ncbi:MAG: HD domain-containing protein [Treponema sp.]|nr:HD domain-containing protein [Treponema sp.]
MLKSIFFCSFIISFIYLFILLTFFRKKISPYYIMLFSSILISNFGYLQLAFVDNLKMALMANQTIYLGTSFSSFFLFMCVADLCKNKIRLFTQVLLILYGMTIFLIASSYPHLKWYYKDVKLIFENGVSVIKKEYGFFHAFYPLYLLIATASGFYLIIKSFYHRKTVSYKNSILLMTATTMIVIAYAVEKITGTYMPLVSMSYVVGQTIVLFILLREKDFDVGYISSELILETSIGGIVCFDSKKRFLGADQDAYNWFYEISGLKIDSKFKSENSDFFSYIEECITGENKKEQELFFRNERYYSVEHIVKREKTRNMIHCFFLKDVTIDQLHHQEMKNINDNLEKIVYEKTKKMRRIQNDIIRSMAITVENRDSNTGGHIQRTSDVVKIFTDHLIKTRKFKDTFSDERFRATVRAAYLHDFGKIAIPDKILNKPGRFDPDEYEEMKKHSEKGAAIVKKILTHSEDRTFKEIAENVAHYHHEKWNGLGYPDQISGENIPFEARIMALADVFDALVSKRVYKDSMSFDDAFKIIEEDAGEHFDPELAVEFLVCRNEIEEFYNSCNERESD